MSFLSELRCWLPQSVDNFELRLCTRLPKPTSQGCSCLALLHQCPSILLSKTFISLIGPFLLPGLILLSTRPLFELAGLSTSPQSWQSSPELFQNWK